MEPLFQFTRGHLPILISMPHGGAIIPDDISRHMTAEGRATPDADFFIDRLYRFAQGWGASTLRANFSRYVIDLNRPPNNSNLYPGQFSTDLCPTVCFAGQPLYTKGCEPSVEQIQIRLKKFWKPYHDAVSRELKWLHDRYGIAILWDAHSIKSNVPSLFKGILPEYNLGTNDNHSCALAFESYFHQIFREENISSYVFNGRFKGGFITRHYGRPNKGIHALQLELAQRIYMNEDTNTYTETSAKRTCRVISRMLDALIGLARI